MMKPFGERLWTAMRDVGPLCIGIDPHPHLLTSWGLTDTPEGVETFGRRLVKAIADDVAVVKPQSAFFERFGSKGIYALERVIADARAAGLMVICDVKRGDIGSTAKGYADAYMRPESPLCVDAITVSPYLGVDSLEPFYDVAARYGAGVFALALTSNPGGAVVQGAVTTDGRTVAQRVLDDLAFRNEGVSPLGSFGAVVGATLRETRHSLSTVNGPFLAPGIGAQGAGIGDLAHVFADVLPAVLPSVSRRVLGVGPSTQAVRDTARRLQDECKELISRESH